jgi:gamma-glutamylcyclotransferase (GGCT)/AIG2-like uncharacterized protein YtfP
MMTCYFAYGSNMDPERMRKRGVTFVARRSGILENHALVFNKSSADARMGYANIIPDKGSNVEGIVYTLVDTAIHKLDLYEDYPVQYDRIPLDIQFPEGGKITCQVYVAQPDKVKKGLKPSASYLAHLLKGRYYLSESYYNQLMEIQTLPD